MRSYGIRRNWNETEDAIFKNRTRASARMHTRIKKTLHRRERRIVRMNTRDNI